jgi:DNA-binding NarL/FixJ family response regulator
MPLQRRVLIVEDEPLIRNLVANQLSQEGFEVHTASDAAEARKKADALSPDVAVLDVELGFGPTGFDLAAIFRKQDPGIALVFLTHLPEPRLIGLDNRIVPKNAAYLVKDRITDPAILIEAIEAALRERVGEHLRDDRRITTKFSGISRSQIEVLHLMASGFSNQQIADHRGTTVRAVENLIKRAFEAAGISGDNQMHMRVTAAREYLKAIGQLRQVD